MLHMLTYFSFVYSFAPLSDCVIRFLREKKNSRHSYHSDGLPIINR